MDEKGFNIGLQNTMKRVVAKDQLQSKKLLGASQDGSREFITLVAGICADGTALPPALIYEGKSGDLQDTWLEDYDHSRDEAYFAATAKGWTNEDLGVSWFMKVFQPKTAPKAGKGYRMLIVDGHSSHVNMRFVNKCDEYRIILAILPPHSTHRLQPLDLKIFSPLSTYYSQELDRVIQSSCGYSRVTKRSFWSIFKIAWQKASSKANILSAFRAAGIHPLNPDIILNQLQIRPSTPPPDDSDAPPTTPSSVRGVRRQIKALRLATGGLVDDVALICRAAEKLVISNDILEHENKGLRMALQTEQKRRKRGKKMGLFPKDEPGQAMFFSPAKIAAVRQHQEDLEAQRRQEVLDKKRQRQSKAAERERKAQEDQERKETRQRRIAENKALKEQQQEARQRQKEVDLQLKGEQKASRHVSTPSTAARKPKSTTTHAIQSGGVNLGTSRHRGSITLPKRFRNK